MNTIVNKILEEGGSKLWATMLEAFAVNVAAHTAANAVGHVYNMLTEPTEEEMQQYEQGIEAVGGAIEPTEDAPPSDTIHLEYEELLEAVTSLLNNDEYSEQTKQDLRELLEESAEDEPSKKGKLLKTIEKLAKELQ